MNMKQKIKLLLVGIGGLFLLFTVIGLIIPSSVKISRGIIIEADSVEVMQAVMNVKTWPEWMSWMQSESGVLIQFTEQNSQPAVEWRSVENKAKGRISLTAVNSDLIEMLHEFPGMNAAKGGIRIRSAGQHQTEVLWMMEYPLRWYPWERFEGIFLDSMIGSALEKALNELSEYMQGRGV
jgi:uncharacterized membrane protein